MEPIPFVIFAVCTSVPISVLMLMYVFNMREANKTITEQQKQIDDMKRELEELKRKP